MQRVVDMEMVVQGLAGKYTGGVNRKGKATGKGVWVGALVDVYEGEFKDSVLNG